MLSFTTLLIASQLLSIDLTASIGPGIGRGSAPQDSTLSNSTKITYLFNAGGNFINLGAAAIGWELPFALGGPERTVTVPQTAFSTSTYTAKTNLIFTPGVRLRIVPASPVTPWVSAGFGFAQAEVTGARNESGYLPTLSIAGGVDWKVMRFALLRAEVRNYRFSNLDIPLVGGSGLGVPSQNNLMFMVGAGLRF